VPAEDVAHARPVRVDEHPARVEDTGLNPHHFSLHLSQPLNERRALVFVLAVGGVLLTWPRPLRASVEDRQPGRGRGAELSIRRGASHAAILPRSQAGAGVPREGPRRTQISPASLCAANGHRQLLGHLVRPLPVSEIPDLVALQEKYKDTLAGDRHLETRWAMEVVKRFAGRAPRQLPVAMTTPESITYHQRAPPPSISTVSRASAEACRHAFGAHHRVRARHLAACRSTPRLKRSISRRTQAEPRARRAGVDDSGIRPGVAAAGQAH